MTNLERIVSHQVSLNKTITIVSFSYFVQTLFPFLVKGGWVEKAPGEETFCTGVEFLLVLLSLGLSNGVGLVLPLTPRLWVTAVVPAAI